MGASVNKPPGQNYNNQKAKWNFRKFQFTWHLKGREVQKAIMQASYYLAPVIWPGGSHVLGCRNKL